MQSKLVFMSAGRHRRWGLVDGGEVIELAGPIFGALRLSARSHRLEAVRLLAPCRPGKIIAVGRNYRDHAREKNIALPGEPRLFFKAPSAVIGPDQPILLPHPDHLVEHEAELGFVIGRRARNIDPADALHYILGFTCCNDVSDRTIQERENLPDKAKSFDTFLPVGPWIATGLDPAALDIECRVNGALRQSANTGQMVFPVPLLLAFISRIMTLFPGDLVLTGTPGGVSALRPGDRVEVTIAGIGALANPVAQTAPQPLRKEPFT